jgi:phenylpyruvate tautomerase PptA (4-oxalocrotonate tautomerase family)
MPMIDLTYPRGAFDDETRAVVVERLTAALLRNEGAPDNEQTRAMSWLYLHELAPECIHRAGERAEAPLYRVLLTAPSGTVLHGPGPMGSIARKTLVREVTEILLEAEGTEYSAAEAGRVYCMIHEVPDGHWGGMGLIFRIEDIVAFANEELPQTPVADEAREALAEGTAADAAAPVR